jgi:hypothetical protein
LLLLIVPIEGSSISLENRIFKNAITIFPTKFKKCLISFASSGFSSAGNTADAIAAALI